MLRMILAWVAAFVLLGGVYAFGAAQETSGAAKATGTPNYGEVLGRYCVTCHNEKLKTAGLMLDKMNVEKVGEGAAGWEKVVRKLRAGQMPPAGMPRPDKATYESFATYLETSLDHAAAAQPNPGRTAAVHRLNRTEYANAIRDLLAVEMSGESLLPPDDSGYGFDNIGDVLSVSPMLLERYMSAAGKISRLAIGDPAFRSVAESTYEAPKLLLQDDRMSEDLPFGSRGGMAIHHRFPLDGEYKIKILLQRNHREYIRGLADPHQLDIRLDGARIKTFTVGGEHRGKSGPIFASATEVGEPAQEDYEHTADEGLEFRIPVKAGTRLLALTFQKDTPEPEGAIQPRPTTFNQAQFKGGDPAIGTVVIAGPYDAKGPGDTPSRGKIFVCHPSNGKSEDACARKILSTLARRAYRRPVADADIQPLLQFFKAGRLEGDFEAGIEMALQRMLVSMDFLFRMERDPSNIGPDTPYRVSDLELASRLSFFLWSSIPDDELLTLAEQGKLKNPAVLERQVRRMLADSRSKALVNNFAGQWLYLRNVRLVSPDRQEFPDFDDNLQEAFQRETELFFESMVREDRSALDLLDANYTYVNERLARHYGIPNVYGSHFRRVTLSDETRRGLLGQGSILTVTSYANRTSPVLRGKWVLENILGTPPPPPPPNVPSLKDNKETRALTMRQQMEAHRANPVCASCHRVMDPLGFALENFDAVGHWRTTSGANNTPIDSSGAMPDGTKFEGAAELRKLLSGKRDEFAITVTDKLLTYALGRGVEYYDAPAVRSIIREAAPSEYRWSSLVIGIVKSLPFQMRRSRPS